MKLGEPSSKGLEVIAPRVGNLLVDASHAVFAQVQALVPLMNLQVIFVCRGTEKNAIAVEPS